MTDIATAAQSGASATAQFQRRARDGARASTERVNTVVSELISAAHDIVRRHHLTYPEYDALKAWLIQVGLDGVLEHAVEQEVNAERPGSKGTIEGPYYVPGAPSLPAQTTLPMREDEPGTPLRFAGRVQRVDGGAIDNATIDIWHADDAGFYSQFAPRLPEWNLRGVVHAGGQGRFDITTIVPAPYQIPTDGAT